MAVPILKMGKQRYQKFSDSLEVPRWGGMELGWGQGLRVRSSPSFCLSVCAESREDSWKKHSAWSQTQSELVHYRDGPLVDDPAEMGNQTQLRCESSLIGRPCQEDATPCKVISLEHLPLGPSRSRMLPQSLLHDCLLNWREGRKNFVLGSESLD